MSQEQTTIIFACIHNAGRSQMAAALFNKYKHVDNVVGISAGTEPADKVHPNVVEVMKDLDVDLSQGKPQRLTEELAKQANIIVTMGCNEKCPYVPGVKIIDWQIPDPKNSNQEATIKIRDYIKDQIENFIKENNW
jgi:protein-tyrosine-phosphatase